MFHRLILGFSVLSLVWMSVGCASTPSASTEAPNYSTAKDDKPIQRNQYKGKTTFEVSPEATKSEKYLTPLPVEYLDLSAHLPIDMEFLLPFEGTYKVMTGYGYESNSWTHQTIANKESANDFFAIDFDMPVGVDILAPASGRVVTSQDRTTTDSYGKYIVIDHGNGYHSIYAHLSHLEFVVDHGDPEVWVRRGQIIAKSGSSGVQNPHLHFAIHKDSRISHSGCDVAGKATIPEPISGYYGIRSGQILTSSNIQTE